MPNPPSAIQLPDFLVVGAQKSGTTWLDAVLRTHPDVYMPSLRKEVHFFDANFDKGAEWYARYFADAGLESRLGEATPMYLFDPEVPGRIFSTIPDARIVAILRNPTDRAISHYRHAQFRRGFSGSFTDFMSEDDSVIERGMYAGQIQRYLDLWPRESFLALIFEDAVREPDELGRILAAFLNVDACAFGPIPSNDAAIQRPAMRRTRSLAAGMTTRIQSPVLDRVLRAARSIGAERALGFRDFMEATSSEREMLDDFYAPEISRIEEVLGVELDGWYRS